ncbi:hypothetical protein F4677DRAFT_371169 [Hypoxylon crocopeplum]|nr:hypothetical protein F4677DRAFT_371169 [Hypoxylon crocopeplum]
MKFQIVLCIMLLTITSDVSHTWQCLLRPGYGVAPRHVSNSLPPIMARLRKPLRRPLLVILSSVGTVSKISMHEKGKVGR